MGTKSLLIQPQRGMNEFGRSLEGKWEREERKREKKKGKKRGGGEKAPIGGLVDTSGKAVGGTCVRRISSTALLSSVASRSSSYTNQIYSYRRIH